ncbi:uncharacterized protein LOC125275676 [Megalobrama amblycephala]|uniref:uncharacterized protein LOC125275676 n=1 Tax=Megalobrama amblycephala TaxID=75352 RepID=UPI002014447D|nr:uncharacterized protein LOC125275676 [Megalobrama amblycephala]XP_048058809.1 uncharacterized protein LOC125275676 [Megalobrama amblycephala]XP_048058810.1 uncharacterized protein LOC125275676 [Megalobrama amblycephala]
MSITSVAVISTLLCSAWSSTIKAKDEHRTAFFGEDVHIPVPALDTSEVLFKPRVEPVLERVLLRNRTILDTRAKLNVHISHLILEDVGEEDEGTYVVKNSAAPADVRRIILVVRDCALETVVKYGDTYHIPINPAIGPYTLEFRPGALTPVNQTTEEPPVILLNQTGIPMEEYENRLTVGEKRVNLFLVTGADEGSYTIKDSDEKVRLRACLNVKDHQIFEHLNYGETLKIKLHVDHTKVKMVYIPDSDHKERLIMDQGELTLPVETVFEGRASVEGSIFYLKKIKVSDMGVFRVMDFSGFRIADVYLHVEPYKLPQLYVAIISLLSLLAFLLLVCLLSCLIKVHRRAERARKISLIAQQAGKGDGEAFRQVVHEVYTRFTEESTVQSTWENNTESTEVEIKGLEVSKPGQYQALQSDKNFLEMNDSGVEFTTSALPLDSDTDVPDNLTSHKLLIESDTLAGVPPAISEGDHSATRTPDSILSASPVVQPQIWGSDRRRLDWRNHA